MSMVEPNNCWDGIVSGANSEEFANILNILDFPMESLELDDTADDLDASNFQNMGPIPLDALTGFPLVSQIQVADGREIKGSSRNAPVDTKSERIEPEKCVGYNSGASTPCDRFISRKFRTFITPSPVSFLESGGSCSSVKCSTTKPEIAIMRRTRSRRKRPSNLHCWFQTSIICSGSVSNRSSNSGNHKDFNEQRLSESSNASEGLRNVSREARKEPLVGFYATREQETTPGKQSLSTKKCTHCQVKKTPQWREGPLGPKTLCNACGVRYRSGRLFPEYRPASSPTFVPSFHSNLHKKVIEMRKKTTQKGLEAEIPPMSPLPEFVPVSNYLFDPL